MPWRFPTAVLVGHDWGATHAWNAALMRPDRFKAVFCLSVPYVPRGDVSVFDRMRKAGHQNDFYMFEQIRPEADQIWADAAVTIPGILYWASAASPVAGRWSPLDPSRSLYRRAPGPLPSWAPHDYVEHNIAEFQRTGFHGGLNYYRAAEPYFDLSAPFKGAKIAQPSFFIWGKADGLRELYPLSIDQMHAGLPGLVGGLELRQRRSLGPARGGRRGEGATRQIPASGRDRLTSFASKRRASGCLSSRYSKIRCGMPSSRSTATWASVEIWLQDTPLMFHGSSGSKHAQMRRSRTSQRSSIRRKQSHSPPLTSRTFRLAGEWCGLASCCRWFIAGQEPTLPLP